MAALMAMLALLYATGFATLAHAAGMPMMMPASASVQTHDARGHEAQGHDAQGHDARGHDAMAHDHAMMDHGTMDHASIEHDTADQPAPPCDTGCALCKDCALCLFTGLPTATPPSVTLHYAGYRPLAVALRNGVRPDLPAEPPRV